MKLIRDPKKFQAEMERLRKKGRAIGFVPTMGALHEGHLSLVRAARRENDVVAVSIFVNPLQFGPKEDLKKYPRTLKEDRRLLEEAKADYLFPPSPAAMYPEGFKTVIDAGGESLSKVLCGKFRPGHFRGVCTVAAKLFNLAKPDRVYFGAKDYQQAAILRRMILDLNTGIEFRLMPTVREKDGLAMSSRNRYLSPEERRRALGLSRILFWMRSQIKGGERDILRLKRAGLARLKTAVDRVDYLEIVDPETLESLRKFQPRMVIAAACFAGKTRLIDNVIIRNFKEHRGTRAPSHQ